MHSISSSISTQSYDFFGQNGAASKDILVEMYNHLPSLKDRAALAATNQRLFHIFQTNVIWEPLLVQHFGEKIPKNSGPKGGYNYYKEISQYRENIVAGRISKRELLNCETRISCFQKVGNKVYIGTMKGQVEIWDLDYQKKLCVLGQFGRKVIKIQVEGNFLAALSFGLELKVWNLTTNSQLFSKQNVVSFHLDKDCLYTQLDSQSRVELLNLNTMLEQEAFEFDDLQCWYVFNKCLYINQEKESNIQVFSTADQKLIKNIYLSCNLFDQFSIREISVDQTYLYTHLSVGATNDIHYCTWDLSQSTDPLYLQFKAISAGYSGYLDFPQFVGDAGNLYFLAKSKLHLISLFLLKGKTIETRISTHVQYIQPQKHQLWGCCGRQLNRFDFFLPCESVYSMDVLEQNLEVIKILACLAKYKVNLNEDSLNNHTSKLHPDILQTLQIQNKRFGTIEKDGFFCEKSLVITQVLILIELAFHANYLCHEEEEKKLLKQICHIYPEAIQSFSYINGDKLKNLNELYDNKHFTDAGRLSRFKSLKEKLDIGH